MPWALDLLFRCSLREHVAFGPLVAPPSLVDSARSSLRSGGKAMPARSPCVAGP